MKISTEIGSAAKIIGEEKAVEYVAKAGFDAWDLSMFSMCKYDRKAAALSPNDHPLAGADHLNFVRRLKKIGLDNGIHCNQSHAPFSTRVPEIRAFLKRAIECTAEAGGEICVIHPDNYKNAQENAELYLELLPFAKNCGVKLAAENMWLWDREKDEALPAACSDPESFCAHIDVVGDEFLVACLDIGHAEMKGLQTTAVEMIRALGPRLQALHLHDNDQWHDSHQIPFSMQIDFLPIVQALKEMGYQGYFTLEADQYLKDRAPETVLEGFREMAASAKRLAELFEKA